MSKDEQKKQFVTKRRIQINEKDNGGDENKKIKKAKKFVFIEIDDEVTTVIDKVRSIKFKQIVLVVPMRALIFQSVVNLKILKKWFEENKKQIVIVSKDMNGQRLCERIGIKIVYGVEGLNLPNKSKLKDEKIAPIKANENRIEEVQPSRRKEAKISIMQLLKAGKELPKVGGKVKQGQIKNGSNLPKIFITANKQALAGLIITSLILLLSIFYIALPGATIELVPRSSILKVSANIVLADFVANKAELETNPPRQIPSFEIKTEFEKVLEYPATGFKLDGKAARGLIKVVNTSSNEWPLVAKTRFRNSDGIIFRSLNQVVIPPAKGGNPGEKILEVVADPLDEKGVFVGARGNLSGEQKFTLPGLSEENQKRIYAVLESNFSGGVDTKIKVVSQNDLNAAIEKMKNDLKAAVYIELEKSVESRNREQNTDLVVLKDMFEISDPIITVPSDIVGKEMNSFEVNGKIKVSGVAYSKSALMNILKNELRLRKNPEKRIVKIDESSVTYAISEINKANKKIKITPIIQAVEEFELSKDRENGIRLLTKIKEKVAGMDVNEAKSFIEGLPEIEKVNINVWPAWNVKMPNIVENINIVVKR